MQYLLMSHAPECMGVMYEQNNDYYCNLQNESSHDLFKLGGNKDANTLAESIYWLTALVITMMTLPKFISKHDHKDSIIF